MTTTQTIFVLSNKFFGLAFLSLSFLLCYAQTIRGLFNLWLQDGDYSYALSIPLITAFIIWKKRRLIASTPVSTFWLGGVFFFIFLIISIYGILGSSPSAVRPALPLIILSICLFCFGKDIFKIMAFPLSLLIFMIPLPTLVQTKISVPLKSISTKLGELILRLLDVSVFVEGNIIDLGVTQLQVADACSGLRYILPLLALGVIFVYFFEKSRWKQATLVVSTIPIAIVTNALRIGGTGFLAQKFSLQLADSFFHGFSGWLLFLFALMLLFVFFQILSYIHPLKAVPTHTQINDDRNSLRKTHNNSKIAMVISSILLTFTGILGYATAALPPLKIDKGLTSFPLHFDGWQGRLEDIDSRIIALSGAEDAFNGIYRSLTGKIVSLYIGYRGSPFTESENFFHSPNVCLPSIGWKTLASENHKITGVAGFSTIVVRKMIIEKMGYRQLVYYWFQTKSHVSSDVNINRLHLTLHALNRDNTHDLFIRPITLLGPDEKAAEAEKRLDQFVRDMMDTLLKFLSENQTTGRR
jgi:exosortase D (VPLPA-CTERM-specific)